MAGSELDLLDLPIKRIWRKLSILELCDIQVGSGDLARVLSRLTGLQDLKSIDMPRLEPSVFLHTSS